MENYAKRLIKICHKHGALAIGGMAAFTPGQDPKVREIQSNKVALDKKRESELGHDGCWVSHPYFISIAMKQFKATNQLDRLLPEFSEQPNLIPRFEGKRTLAGLRTNIRVGIAYVEGWNRGLGCISIDGLMEDLATLEISRAQVWQWLYHGVRLDDKILVTKDLIIQIFEEETERLLSEKSESMESLEEYKVTCAKFLQASRQCQNLFLETELPDFFTTYWEGQHHVNDGNRKKLGDQRQMEGHSA
jgi:malate synthase